MDDYNFMADNYRYLMEQGKIDKDEAEKEIRIYEFLATCDEDDICRLVDSAAFNNIIKAYLRKALIGAEIDEKTQKKVLDELNWLFDTVGAKEVLQEK